MALIRTDLENYTLDFANKDSGVLVVSFESMTPSITHPSRDRLGWGYRFLEQRNESVLYVKPTKPHWYRRPDFHKWLDDNTSFFRSYDRVVVVGGSMGGYGALAFSKAMCASQVLALNPQTTLAKDLAPWENRFARGERENWEGRFRDGACELHGDVHVVADRYEKLDRLHVDRMNSINYYNFPFVGHKIPAWLSQVNGLKPLMRAVIEGKREEEISRIVCFFSRRRRNLEAWWLVLYKISLDSNRLDRLKPFEPLRVCRRLQLLSKVEHHEQDDEQVFP